MAACAQTPMLPEYRPLPPVRVVQVLSDAELAETRSVWTRCGDCPVVTVKTRIEAAPPPAPAPLAVARPPSTPPRPDPLPRTELRFGFKSVVPDPAMTQAIQQWATSWGAWPRAALRITAYAENTRASLRLCDERAQAVQIALQHAGIPFTQFQRLVVVAPNPARRVAVEVIAWPSDNESPVADARAPAGLAVERVPSLPPSFPDLGDSP